MNKFLTKVATALVGCAMAIGVGVAIGNENKAERAEATPGDLIYHFIGDSYFTSSSYASVANKSLNSGTNPSTISSASWAATVGNYTSNTTTSVFGTNANSNKLNLLVLSNGNISGNAGIASKLGVNASTAKAYAALIGSTAFDSVGKVSFYTTQFNGAAPTTVYVLSSSDNGTSWSIESQKSSGIVVNTWIDLDFASTQTTSCRYAFVAYWNTSSVTNGGGLRKLQIKFYEGATSGSSLEPLEAPSPEKNGNNIEWEVVDNVDHYVITVDGVEHNTEKVTSYTLSGDELARGYHTVSVVAKAPENSEDYSDSDAGETSYYFMTHAGTEGDPYDTIDACTAIDANTGLTNVYVTGIVSSIVTEYSEQFSNITFDISVNGLTTGKQFRAYHASGSTASSIVASDIVVLYGTLTKYNSIYEFANSCTIISRTIPTYTVTFNANGGSGEMLGSTEQRGDYELPENGFTAPANKEFAGWKANNAGDLYEEEETYSLTGNVEFYAQWNSLYTLSYNANEGTGTVPTSVTKVGGQSATVALPTNLTAPSGKTFDKWNTQADGEGTSYDPDDSITLNSDVELFAIWVNTLTITYHANGGTGEDVEVEWKQGYAATIASNTFAAPAGMTFDKWNTQADGEGTNYNVNASVDPLNASMDLYAVWKLPPQEKKDTLTLGSFGDVSGYDSYSATGSTTNIAYSGFMMANVTNMQFKSKDSVSGIVSTTTKGTVKSVKVTVASGTNTIDIYGSNTKYSAPSELYGNSSIGDKVGSLTTTGTVEFSDDYAYVGIRSNSGALYISEIEITWLVEAKPVVSLAASNVTGIGPFYVGTKPTLQNLGVTVTAYYDELKTDSEVVTTLASISYPVTGLGQGENDYTISYGGKTTTVSITGTLGDVYAKLNSTSELIIGSTIKIATDTYVMTTGTSNSQLVGVEEDPTNANGASAAKFTVGADKDGYYFYETTVEKYLSLTSDNSYLMLSTTLNIQSHWNVSIANNGVATIKNANYTDRFIQKNSSHRFGSFKGGETAVSIFQLVDNDMTESQKASAQIDTFAKLYLHKLDILDNETTRQSDGTTCNSYYDTAKAALTGDWSAIQEVFSQDESGMWERYCKWAWATYQEVPTFEDDAITYGRSYNYIVSDSDNATTIMIIVTLSSLMAIGGYFFLRRKKHI